MKEPYCVQSVVRAIGILEACGAEREGVTVQQLSSALDVRRTTVHNLVRTLLARGWLERRTNPIRYGLGPALVDLVGGADLRRINDRARLMMLRLARKIPYGSFVWGEVQGDAILNSLYCPTGADAVVQHPVNDYPHPYTSFMTLGYQAFSEESRCRDFQARYPFDEYGSIHWKSFRTLCVFLDRTRKSGLIQPFPRNGVFRIAVPVFGRAGKLVGVFGGFCQERESAERKTALMAAVRRVGEEFGR